jgi:hypothetical protein
MYLNQKDEPATVWEPSKAGKIVVPHPILSFSLSLSTPPLYLLSLSLSLLQVRGLVNIYYFIGFEVLTAVIMKSTIFWDITPCSPLKVNRRFGGTYRLHLQGRKISRARNQRESRWQAGVLSRWFLAQLIFRP